MIYLHTTHGLARDGGLTCNSHSPRFSSSNFIMSVRHSNHSQPQSLPPFAVAFSNSSLDKLSSHPTSLPPIQPRPLSERPRSLPEPSQSATMLETTPIPNGRKRSHPDVSQRDDTSSDNRSVILSCTSHLIFHLYVNSQQR